MIDKNHFTLNVLFYSTKQPHFNVVTAHKSVKSQPHCRTERSLAWILDRVSLFENRIIMH